MQGREHVGRGMERMASTGSAREGGQRARGAAKRAAHAGRRTCRHHPSIAVMTRQQRLCNSPRWPWGTIARLPGHGALYLSPCVLPSLRRRRDLLRSRSKDLAVVGDTFRCTSSANRVLSRERGGPNSDLWSTSLGRGVAIAKGETSSISVCSLALLGLI